MSVPLALHTHDSPRRCAEKMRIFMTILMSTLVFGAISGCSREEARPGFIIERRGDFYQDEYWEVIHVYGFGNNEQVAQDLVKYLIESEPGGRRGNPAKYRYRIKD